MLSSKGLKEIVTAARPIIERQLDDAEQIAAFRDKVADAGGDWSALKALIKAQIQDERDESGEGKRVKKILDKAGFSTDYAELLGWSNMNEKNFSAEDRIDPLTGEFLDDEPVTIIDHTDRDGHHITVTVDPQIAAILSRSDGGLDIVTKHTEIASASQGEATVSHSDQRETDREAATPHAGANEGGGNVDRSAERAGLEGGPVNLEPTGPVAERATHSPEEANEVPAQDGEGTGLGESLSGKSDTARPASVDAQPNGRGSVGEAEESVVTVVGTESGTVASFLTKPPSPLRPHCQRPEMCAGVGRTHCHTCSKALEREMA